MSEPSIELVSMIPLSDESPLYIPIGYRSISHHVLKRMGWMTASYPFDAMISRLHVVQHCIETDFQFMLDPENYQEADTKTVHYGVEKPPTVLSRDHLFFNTYYQNHAVEWLPTRIMQLPAPLSFPEDTHSYHLAFPCPPRPSPSPSPTMSLPAMLRQWTQSVNHWRESMQSTRPKRMLYIHPAISESEYKAHKYTLVRECMDFQEWISAKTNEVRVCFVFVVRTSLSSPLTNHIPHTLPDVVEPLYSGHCWKRDPDSMREGDSECDIFAIYANRDLIDAGDFFGHTSIVETDTLCDWVKRAWHSDAHSV
jgi:hypothetical protein